MTRLEKIRSLSVDEMANFLSGIQGNSNESTAQEMYVWLIEPYTADENDILDLSTDSLNKQKRYFGCATITLGDNVGTKLNI